MSVSTQPPAVPGSNELMVLGTRAPLGEYLRELWTRRHFARGLADSDMRAKHMNSVLGQLWHLLNPAMMILVYWVVFGLILDARRGVDNYVSFLVAGVIIFRFTQNAIMGAAKSLAANLGLIRSIQFPRALVPISEVYAQILALIPGIALVAVVAAIDGVRPGPELLALPIVIAAAAMFSVGIGLIAARASTTLADLQQVLPHVFRILLYMSGVLFSVDAAIESQLITNLFALNPFYCIITATRWSILGTPTSIWVPIALSIWTLVSVLAGFMWFRRGEHRYGA